MTLRSFAAACAAAFLACAGLLVMPASPAVAATSYSCKLSFTTTNPLPAWNPTVTMKASPSSPKAGQTVTVVVNVGSYTNGPVTLGKNKLKPQGTVTMSGAQSGSFAVRGPAVGSVVGALKPFKVPAMTGTFVAKKAGTVNLSMKQVQFVYPGPPPVTTTCTAGGGGDSMGSVKVASTGGSSNPDPTPSPTPAGNGGTGNGNDAKDDTLPQTGPVTPAVLIAGLIALQIGLIVVVRSRRALSSSGTR